MQRRELAWCVMSGACWSEDGLSLVPPPQSMILCHLFHEHSLLLPGDLSPFSRSSQVQVLGAITLGRCCDRRRSLVLPLSLRLGTRYEDRCDTDIELILHTLDRHT
jgi:hypothetical protein